MMSTKTIPNIEIETLQAMAEDSKKKISDKKILDYLLSKIERDVQEVIDQIKDMESTDDLPETLCGNKELANELGCSMSTIERIKKLPGFPAPIFSQKKRNLETKIYLLADVRAFKMPKLGRPKKPSVTLKLNKDSI